MDCYSKALKTILHFLFKTLGKNSYISWCLSFPRRLFLRQVLIYQKLLKAGRIIPQWGNTAFFLCYTLSVQCWMVLMIGSEEASVFVSS